MRPEADDSRDRERRALLERLEAAETMLDRNFSVFGIRFGWDAILGLVPVAGDTVAAGASGWVLWKSHKLGVPNRLKARMLSNVVFDYLFGSIPVIGTIFDVAFKANTRNIKLLKEHLIEEERLRAARD